MSLLGNFSNVVSNGALEIPVPAGVTGEELLEVLHNVCKRGSILSSLATERLI